MSALTTMNKKYIYSTLKSASGSVNVIAVVKCCKKPKRTKGSGFSVFVSITDPSLEGGKLPCIFFNDSMEHLPPIQEPGDVIVMHRLVIREFRDQVQGCGFASTGFAATVFSGRVEDPLTPRPCAVKCSFYEAELARVKELRDWYNSPACPVEREPCSLSNPPNPTVAPSDASNMLDVNCSWGPVGTRCTPIQRLWSARATKFISIQGQVVSIYRQTTESDRVILYLWDGPPPENSCISDPAGVLPTHSCTRFYGVPPEHLAYIDATSSHHPELVAITAHGFDETDASNRNCGVWSVPVVVYDEHVTSSTMTSLQPGDLVQINNIHVLICHQPDCPIPGCLRLIVHGGGYQFARGIHRLGPAYFLDEFSQYVELGQTLPDHLQSANEFGLLSNLREGLLRRPPALKIPGSPTVPLTMNTTLAPAP
ncbi:hypothetical protein FGIG_07399 [Fasciola gigantica]|uniref:Protection of telomeres protein 1 n=1 Tax=Fasciola gigantica TaxID=46835 RepID=A0A504YUV7_FASGI|nr:hypothetical protein FGIG_07399 [Fasciola gigantica]